jgi:hypothetical protein
VGIYYSSSALKSCSSSRILSLSAVTSSHFFGMWHTNLYISLVNSLRHALFQHVSGIPSLWKDKAERIVHRKVSVSNFRALREKKFYERMTS